MAPLQHLGQVLGRGSGVPRHFSGFAGIQEPRQTTCQGTNADNQAQDRQDPVQVFHLGPFSSNELHPGPDQHKARGEGCIHDQSAGHPHVEEHQHHRNAARQCDEKPEIDAGQSFDKGNRR